MGRFNLVPRLAAVALATLLAVAVGATALSQQAPSFVDVTVTGAMQGDRIASDGVLFGTADANGSVTQNMRDTVAMRLKGDGTTDPFTVNGKAAMGDWDGYTYTITTTTTATEGSTTQADDAPYVALSLLVDFPQDSDDTIPAGTDTQVRLRLAATDLSGSVETDAAKAKAGQYASVSYDFDVDSLRYVRVSGGMILSTGSETGVVLTGHRVLATASSEAKTPHIATISNAALDVIVPAGTDDESAVISAAVVAGVTVTYEEYTLEVVDDERQTETKMVYLPLNDDKDGQATLSAANASRSGSGTLTIGSVDEVASISFDFSSPKRGSTDPGTSEPNRVSISGGTTEFTLHILNANDKPAQTNAVSSVVVSTTAGTMSFSGEVTSDLNAGGGQCTGNSTTCELEPSRAAQDALPKTGLKFQLAAPAKTGSADIRAVVISRAGKVLVDEQLSVTFVGPAAALDAGDASGTVLGSDVVGKAKDGADKDAKMDGDTGTAAAPNRDADKGAATRDQISFTVNATDKGGNAVVTPNLTAKVTGPDGVAVSNEKFVISQTGDLSEKVHLDIDASASKALKTGAHQIKFSAGSLSSSSSFTVVGTADAMTLDASDNAPGEIGSTVTLTATVMSGDDMVADGTVVRFNASDKTGDDDSVLIATTSESPGTKAGVAEVTYVVVGDGTSVVTATVADDTTPVVEVEVIASVAGAAAAVAEAVSLDCLSSNQGFATYTCGVDSSASELFALVSGRGASAIHLWNGSAWVRYSVVDGTMVPGSSDFTVAENDILYISN